MAAGGMRGALMRQNGYEVGASCGAGRKFSTILRPIVPSRPTHRAGLAELGLGVEGIAQAIAQHVKAEH